jgi:hypothetical protein
MVDEVTCRTYMGCDAGELEPSNDIELKGLAVWIVHSVTE